VFETRTATLVSIDRTILLVVVLGIGLLVGAFAAPWRRSTEVATLDESAEKAASAAVLASSGPVARSGGADVRAPQIERQLRSLTDQLAAETAARQRLQERLETLTEEVAALRTAPAGTGPGLSAAPHPLPSAGAPGAADGAGGLEHALVAAGVDPGTAADIKRRQDGLALEDIFLRDQATREGWLGSPRFNEEMAKIDSQRRPVRDEIGDDAYDRYLAAQGQPNRVQVNDVLVDSPAAQAGLQPGDQVVRYGDTRIFAPGELVAQTHAGTPGDNVQVEVLRGGQLVTVSVPRGPLGINIVPVPAPALSPP